MKEIEVLEGKGKGKGNGNGDDGMEQVINWIIGVIGAMVGG